MGSQYAWAQQTPLNFHHITVRQGLNDGVINAICQDRNGYMWFASLGALNRFNSTSIKKFTTIQGDSTSLPNQVPYAMAAANDDHLWIGYINGLVQFNTRTGKCKRIEALNNYNIYGIKVMPDNKVYLGSYRGLVCYNPSTGSLEALCDPSDSATYKTLYRKPTYDIFYQGQKTYLGSYNGIIEYDMISRKAVFIDLPFFDGSVDRLMIDNKGYFWVSNNKNYSLLRISRDLKQVERLDTLLASKIDSRLSTAPDFKSDGQNRVWIITGSKGLLEYDLETRKANFHRHDDQVQGSLSEDNLRTMYQGKDGTLWVTSNGSIDYFHPDRNVFTTIYPFANQNESKYARGVMEDHAGNLWFTTGNGISQFDPRTRQYNTWTNEAGKKKKIYYNSVRGIAEDKDGRIWIATGAGVNRLDPLTGNMEFLSIKDSVPEAFYFSANRLKDGTIWLGTRDYDGFYYYSPADKKVHSIASHPHLKKFRGRGGRYVLEDSKGRLWFGFNGNGVGMYDPSTMKTREWYNDNLKENSGIAGNLVVDIKEDKNGIVWISAFGGLSGIDIDKDRYYIFNDHNGLKSTIVGPMAIDNLNRLWIGTAAGLALLDSSRTYFTYFNEESGLPVSEFPEHPGYYLLNNDVIMPTVKGYIRFDPLAFIEAKPEVNYYISSFQVFDKEKISMPDSVVSVSLKANENFFSIQLEALNFENPTHTWYAYQLEGFDKDWHITQDPKAVYTNVPGGDYVFHYKATANVNNWNVPEKTMGIHINTIFYKSFWFWLLAGLLLLAVMYWFYTNRIRHQQRVYKLESKAQSLEKEKALVMYENLKQQLNPHFLFNSLTSLGSLINTNPKVASEFLDSLGKTYRYILKSRDNEVVPLGDELRFAESYVWLQQTRFEKGLQVKMHVGEDDHHRKIVPVTLQNMIENAIKHNIIDEETPLIVDIYVEDDYLVISNNLQRKNFVETSNRQGLANLQSLYQYLSDRPVELTETANSFIVKIPLL
jgi:ligand-binding sensor domain-containing protein